ncbi:MAG TPA: Cys-tRNA(Pro) deacylase, partial [Dysgonomonas sp.]|nr:Cys-tRNA(Pro) deacylase [Dysgonomonas sp.]
SVTGYIRGACSPIGMKKLFPTFIHFSCMDFDFIYVSAGIRSLQIKIAPNRLTDIINAQVVNLL